MRTKRGQTNKLEHQRYLVKIKFFYKKPLVQVSANLTLTLLVVCFFVFFAIRPTLVTIVSLQKTLKESKEVNQQLSRKIDSLQQAQKIYAQIVDDLFLVEAALPETAEFQSLALRINYLAFKNNLVLNSASFAGFDLVEVKENLAKGQPKTNYGFTLGLSGSFEQIKSFLTELEQIDRLIKINKVGFSAEKGQVGVGDIQIEIEGEAYWYSKETVLVPSQPETGSEPILETDTELTL